VREYWTAQRMQNAEPADLRLTADGRIAGASPGLAARSAAPVRIPASRAAVDASAANTSFPDRVHGKVFFTINGGSDPGDFVCSATVVSSNSHAVAWTAGHCVYDADFGGGFATNWTFVPGFRNGEQPFGSWPASELFTTRGWQENVNIRLDLGAAELDRDGEGRGIEDVVGARGIAFNESRSQAFTAYGYPALPNPLSLPPRFDFDGQRLYSCASPLTGGDSPPGGGPEPLQIDCDMTGGSSGGGWVIGDLYEKDFPTVRLGSEAIVSVPPMPQFRGRVAYIDPRVDVAARTAKVRVEVTNPAGALRLGMFANVSFIVPSTAVAVVPRTAVQAVGDRSVIYVAAEGDEGRFIERTIKLGVAMDDTIQVLEGLKLGERIVTEGSFFVRAEAARSRSGS